MAPYIPQPEREDIDIRLLKPKSAGQLNFKLTREIQDWVGRHGASYDTYNTIIGVFECCKLEYYRKVVAIYEDKKCEKNGEIY